MYPQYRPVVGPGFNYHAPPEWRPTEVSDDSDVDMEICNSPAERPSPPRKDQADNGEQQRGLAKPSVASPQLLPPPTQLSLPTKQTQKQKQVPEPVPDPLDSLWRTTEEPLPHNAKFLIPLRTDSSDSKVIEFLGQVKEQVAQQKKTEVTMNPKGSELDKGMQAEVCFLTF
jgi:hypothetical protein